MAFRYKLTLLFLLLVTVVSGQNNPQFTQYIFNQFYFNPGAAGQNNRLEAQSTIRSQYTGYIPDQGAGGQILSTAFSADSPVSFIKGGAGIYFSSHNISQAQNLSELSLNYAFHQRINSNIIGYGIGVGLRNLTLQGEHFIPRDPNDPMIPDDKINSMSTTLNLGIYLVNPSYKIGLSVKNVLESTYNLNGIDGLFKENRNFYLTGSYDFPITYTLDVSPMFMVRSDLVTTAVELGALVTYNQKFWVGANYRLEDAGSIIGGVNLLGNRLMAGYALDIVTDGLKAKSATSHELFVRYAISSGIRTGKKTIIKTPRYNIL